MMLNLLPGPVQSASFSDKAGRAAVREILLVVAGYFLATAFFTWPLLPGLSTRIIASGDYYLTTYIQAWVAHTLVTHPSHLFDMNMLYPAKHVLADSENLIGNQLIFAPVYGFSKNATLAANFVTFSSFWLCAIAMYLLVRQITENALGAIIAGFIYGFSPPRLAQTGHSQLLSMQWIPFAVLFLIFFLFHKRVSSLVAFNAFLLLQILSSLYLGYIAIMVCTALFVSTLLVRHDLITRRVIWQLAGSAGVMLALLLPILLPYREAAKGAESASAELSTAIQASASPLSSYINIGGGTSSRAYQRLLGNVRSSRFNWEKILFPGFLAIALSFIGVVYGGALLLRPHTFRETARRSDEGIVLCLVVGSVLVVLGSYILSLGPYLWIHGRVTRIPLPFYWLRLWIPGLAMYRVPARFGLATTFGLAVLSAIGFEVALRFLKSRPWFQKENYYRGLTAIVILLFALEFAPMPFSLGPAMSRSNLPPEYRWLASQAPNVPVVELPITVRGGDSDPTQQAAYAYASMFHWHPLVNGYTGHVPAESQELLSTAARLPAPDSVRQLAAVGVKLVIVHMDELPGFQVSRWRNLPTNHGLLLEQDFQSSRVYRIQPDQALAAAAPEQEDCSADAQQTPPYLQSADDISHVLLNNGFEDGVLAPWRAFQNVTVRMDGSRSHGGNQSLAETGGVGSVYQDAISLVPGGTYTFSVWLSVSPGATATGQLAVYDPSTDQVKFSPPSNGCSRAWQLLSISAVAGREGKLRIHLFRNQGSGSIYWDDVRAYHAR